MRITGHESHMEKAFCIDEQMSALQHGHDVAWVGLLCEPCDVEHLHEVRSWWET